MPGASPPLVRIAIRSIALHLATERDDSTAKTPRTPRRGRKNHREHRGHRDLMMIREATAIHFFVAHHAGDRPAFLLCGLCALCGFFPSYSSMRCSTLA